MKKIMDSFDMVLRANTAEELRVRFENCIHLIQKARIRDTESLLEMLLMRLWQAIQWPTDDNPYCIMDGVNGLLLFLYLYWEDSLEYLKGFVQCLDDFVAPEAERITPDEVHTLYSLVDEKFPYTEQVVRDKPLHIIFMDYSHVQFNSGYFYHNLGGREFVAIIWTHPKKDFFCPQQHSFLHEMGHVVHSRLLKNTHKYPISFHRVLERMFPSCLEQPSKDNVEVFCDCFSIAATHGTKWEESSPWAFFREKDKRQLYFYMKMLISTYDNNPMGKLSYDELTAAYFKTQSVNVR